MSRPRTLVAAAALTLVPLSAFVPSTSYGAGETCDEQPATIVIASEPDAIEFGTAGDDVVLVESGDTFRFEALGGDDTICAGAHTTVMGGEGDDTIVLTAETGPAFANGQAGDDVIEGGPGDDILEGGAGNDVVNGGDGADDISGDDGDDQVDGGPGDDFVGGQAVFRYDRGPFPGDVPNPHDTPGTDTVSGGDGDDLVSDTTSDENLDGGQGDDELVLDDYDYWSLDEECYRADFDHEPVLDVASGTVTDLGSDTFEAFEAYRAGAFAHQTLIGTPGPDRLTANICGRATLDGRQGADVIRSNSCDVRILGGHGDDDITFIGTGAVSAGRGDDTVRITDAGYFDYYCGDNDASASGGPGTDDLRFPLELDFIRVDLTRGVATGNERARVKTFENVFQSRARAPRAQTIIGTAGPNVLVGGSGRTVLRGLGGADRLLGGKGHDAAYGGPGRDVCRAEMRHDCEVR